MTEVTNDSDKTCAQKDRIGDDCCDEGAYYQMPYIYGVEGCMVPEWWCESCVDQLVSVEREGDTVWLCDPTGERLATAEKVLETDGDAL
jgi:hypothetical protein